MVMGSSNLQDTVSQALQFINELKCTLKVLLDKILCYEQKLLSYEI